MSLKFDSKYIYNNNAENQRCGIDRALLKMLCFFSTNAKLGMFGLDAASATKSVAKSAGGIRTNVSLLTEAQK